MHWQISLQILRSLNEIDVFFISRKQTRQHFSKYSVSGWRIQTVLHGQKQIRAWDYLKENFPRKIINSHKFPGVIEIICFEFSISDKKCLLLRKYRHPSQYDEFFLNELKWVSGTYENFLVTGDFNMTPEN